MFKKNRVFLQETITFAGYNKDSVTGGVPRPRLMEKFSKGVTTYV